MSEFKVGDEVYFYELKFIGKYPWIMDFFEIKSGEVTFLNKNNGVMHLSNIHNTFNLKHPLFKSKNEAIDAMIKRLEEMRDE